MNYTFLQRAVTLSALLAVVFGISFANGALAAPQKVSYRGAKVTSAVPGKPFTLKFQVKNTGDTTYSDVKVIFHIPNGLAYSTVSPSNADINDGTITWSNVPLEPNQSFYPSFTFTVDSGVELKKKLSIWVEVTGKDMEATSTNFSVTAVKGSTVTKTTLSSADVKALFITVYGRTPTASELKYWVGRKADKPTKTSLGGAMGHHKNLNIKH